MGRALGALLRLLRLAVGGAVLVGCTSVAAQPQAGAATVPSAAAGFRKFMLGDFEITALSDGAVDLPLERLLLGITPQDTRQALGSALVDGHLKTAVNAYLVNTGTKLVLVDAGDPFGLRPTLGRLRANLQAAGYVPEQVDLVLLTHMHRDHVGGLAADGRRAFPNATVHAARQEAEHWLDQRNMERAPLAMRSFYPVARAALEPYQAAGRFETFDTDKTFVPGIRAHRSAGHTPGHTAYVVESRGARLVLWGDLVHVQAIQFARPYVALQFDADPQAAIEQRERAFAEAARLGYWVAASHLPFPGIGRVVKETDTFLWEPVHDNTLR